jgi:geranylgeranyl diphosphate synthase type I
MSLQVQLATDGSALASEESVLGTVDMAVDRAAVDAALSDFLAAKQELHSDPSVVMFIELLRNFLAGGKRLRPLLCCTGWRAVGGIWDLTPAVVSVAASLELFHAFALIQDDVMDDSDIRRGEPAVHRVLAARHADHPRSNWLGANTAILLGDLALGWSYELAQAAVLDTDQTARLWPALDTMRAQTLCGQYLDLLATGRPSGTVEQALAIARHKTAVYSVESPLRLGAVLAGADEDALAACSAYGILVGEVFQLRDDLLGVFGDPAQTGKPVLDDLRAGKSTVLLTIARQRADSRQRSRLDALIGNPALDRDGVIEAGEIFIATGAYATVEQMMTARCQRALDVLSDARLHPVGTAILRQLAAEASQRHR